MELNILIGGITLMQYAITFNNKTEFDTAYNKLNQAGLIGEVKKASRLPQMEEITGEKKELKVPEQLETDGESVSAAFNEARIHDVRAAIEIMKEYQVDNDVAKAISALKEITSS